MCPQGEWGRPTFGMEHSGRGGAGERRCLRVPLSTPASIPQLGVGLAHRSCRLEPRALGGAPLNGCDSNLEPGRPWFKSYRCVPAMSLDRSHKVLVSSV